MSKEAKANGLTAEILEVIVDEDDPFQTLMNITPRKGLRDSTELIREEREKLNSKRGN